MRIEAEGDVLTLVFGGVGQGIRSVGGLHDHYLLRAAVSYRPKRPVIEFVQRIKRFFPIGDSEQRAVEQVVARHRRLVLVVGGEA